MGHQTLLEICLDSVESCIAAEQGGARRVELCADLAEDGITPSAGMIAAARKSVRLGIHVMIRPRGGDFCYSEGEYEIMKRDIAFAKELGADGVVFGILRPGGSIDEPRTRELAALARPMQVTFHRAFDVAPDPSGSLEILVASGVDRILTSGQAPAAAQGIDVIRRLVTQASGRIEIMAGVGITADNVRKIRNTTGVKDIHVGSGVNAPAGQATQGGLFRGGAQRIVDPGRVSRIVDLLRE
jgi:copper homeostasis protein